MKFSITIDNISSFKKGLNIQEAYLYAWLYSLPSWAENVVIDGKPYYFASRTKAIEELPLLTDKADTMYRYYKSLEAKGLIVLTKIQNKDFIGLTDFAKQWNNSENFPTVGNEPENARKKIRESEKNPNKLGKFSEKDSEKNPTYNNTSINKNTIDTTTLEKEIFKNDFSEKEEEQVPDFVKENRKSIAPATGGRLGLTKENLKDDLMSNEYCRMQASRDGVKEDYEQAVDYFLAQKFGIEENLKWKDIQDARRNFTNWIPYQAKRINQNGNSTEKSARIIRFDDKGNAISNGDTSRPFQPNNNGQKNKPRFIILGADQLPDFSNVGQ